MADSRPLSILLVMASSNPVVGGLEKHTRELANGLAQAGHRVSVMCAAAHHHGLAEGVQRITLNPKQSRYNPLLLARFHKQLRAGNYDIVHAQGTKAAALLAVLAHLPLQPALVASFHGFKSRYPALQRFNAVIAVSQALADHLPAANVRLVYNGLTVTNEAVCANAELTATTPKPTWLAVGRLVSVKGFDFLIDSFKGVNGSLTIAGDGPEKAHLQRKIDDCRLKDRVTLLGHRDDVGALMSACDGVVISSRREGFSYVFAEAMLANKPVIATNVPIANEFLPAEHIYRGAAPEDFARLLNSNLKTVFSAQSQARQRAQQELTLAAMVEGTTATYRDVLGKS